MSSNITPSQFFNIHIPNKYSNNTYYLNLKLFKLSYILFNPYKSLLGRYIKFLKKPRNIVPEFYLYKWINPRTFKSSVEKRLLGAMSLSNNNSYFKKKNSLTNLGKPHFLLFNTINNSYCRMVSKLVKKNKKTIHKKVLNIVTGYSIMAEILIKFNLYMPLHPNKLIHDITYSKNNIISKVLEVVNTKLKSRRLLTSYSSSIAKKLTLIKMSKPKVKIMAYRKLLASYLKLNQAKVTNLIQNLISKKGYAKDILFPINILLPFYTYKDSLKLLANSSVSQNRVLVKSAYTFLNFGDFIELSITKNIFIYRHFLMYARLKNYIVYKRVRLKKLKSKFNLIIDKKSMLYKRVNILKLDTVCNSFKALTIITNMYETDFKTLTFVYLGYSLDIESNSAYSLLSSLFTAHRKSLKLLN